MNVNRIKDRVVAVLAAHYPPGFVVTSADHGTAAAVTGAVSRARLQQYAATLREAGLHVSDRSEAGQLYVRERIPEPPHPPTRTDAEALDIIAEWLRDPEWGSGMLEDIAETVRSTGRSVEDYADGRATWDRH